MMYTLADRLLAKTACRILRTLNRHPEGLTYSELLDFVYHDIAPNTYLRAKMVGGSFAYHLKRLAKIGLIEKYERRYYITHAGLLMLRPIWSLKEAVQVERA